MVARRGTLFVTDIGRPYGLTLDVAFDSPGVWRRATAWIRIADPNANVTGFRVGLCVGDGRVTFSHRRAQRRFITRFAYWPWDIQRRLRPYAHVLPQRKLRDTRFDCIGNGRMRMRLRALPPGRVADIAR